VANHSTRTNKVEKELQSLVGQYLNTSLPSKHGGIVSVSRVRVSGDFKNAKVYVSYFHPQEDVEALKDVMDSIENSRRDLQQYVNRHLKLKFTPKFSFFVDNTLEENFNLIQKLRALGFDVNALTDEEKCQN
jgi:ribosome-binding factor A